MFNQPTEDSTAGGVFYFKPADNDGDLLLIETVIEAGREFDQMTNSERDFRVVSLVNLDRDATPATVKVTQSALVRKLPAGQTMILGRLGKAKTSNGYNAWVLNPYTPADAAKAKAWLDGGRPAGVDPLAADAKKAEAAGLTPEQYAELKRLGMIKDETLPF